jgi:hypothetical protein
MNLNKLAYASAVIGIMIGAAACGSSSSPPPSKSSSPAAASAPSPTPSATTSGPQPTADDILCAQALVVAMRAGLDHSIINSADITAAQQSAEGGLEACQPVITKHGEGLDKAVWNLTAAAGFTRSRWDK